MRTPVIRPSEKPEIPNWELVERDEVRRLERVFPFSDFAGALAFTNRVGALAQEKAIIRPSSI